MKKIMSLVVALLMVFAFSASAFANSDTQKVQKVKINEYQMLKELSKKSESEMKKLGYSSKDVEKIKNHEEEYVKHLKKYAELDDESLKNLGYSSEKIQMLRVYDGSEAQTLALGAEVNIQLTIDYVTWSESQQRTNARLEYNYDWDGVPLVKMTDLVAVSWNNWVINGKYAVTTYKHIYGTQPDIYDNPTFVENDGPEVYGAGYEIEMTKQDNYYWAQSGQGIFTLYHNNGREDLSAYVAYGHFGVSLTPSFFIPGFGAIVFDPDTTQEDDDQAFMECEN